MSSTEQATEQTPGGRRRGRKGVGIELGLKWPLHERPNGTFAKAVLAEFLCTTMFIFVSVGSIAFGCHVSTSGTGGAVSSTGIIETPEGCLLRDARLLQVATCFGLAIAILVYASATFSGGHLNPAVTIAMLIAKKVSLMRAVAYWVVQFAGAILGSALIYAVDRSGWDAANGGINDIIPGITHAAGWLLEMLLTALLVFVVFAATDSKRGAVGAHLPVLAPFAIGFTVFVCHLVAIPIDNCCVNPARWLGPAVITGDYAQVWPFLVGPISGAILAAVLYELCFRPSHKKVLTLPEHEHYGDAHHVTLRRHDGDEHRVSLRQVEPIKLPEYAGYRGRDDHTVLGPNEARVPTYVGLRGVGERSAPHIQHAPIAQAV